MKYLLCFLLSLVLAGCALSGVAPVRPKVEEPWKTSLSRAGEASAQYALGLSLCCGRQEAEDTVEWLCAAARSGHVPAQFALGRLYAGVFPADDVVPTHYPTALMWYNLAEQNGFNNPPLLHDYRHHTLSHMNAEEVEVARKMMDEWQKVPCGKSTVRGGWWERQRYLD